MKFKVAILTSPNQWFIPYAKELSRLITGSELFFSHRDVVKSFDVVFMLGYHRIVKEKFLAKHSHNIVVHASDLPKGKGWAPMFWQILEGKNDIVFTMFEASTGVDDGDIYMQKTLSLDGSELNEELRRLQAELTVDMCLDFVECCDKYKLPSKQQGEETFYKRRGPKDSKLDVNKTLGEQFNLLRIVDNEEYPAYFEHLGRKYILKITEG